MNARTAIPLAALAAALGWASPSAADQLYRGDRWAAVASDERASEVGDIITVLISESASSSSRLQQNSSRDTDIGGSLVAGPIGESAALDFGGSYAGRGEIVRSDRFATQMSALVVDVLANGDLTIEGSQFMLINGEETRVAVRGRVRKQDIQSGNYVLSSRIAQAEIDYDGKGFVTRSAKPGLINRIFSFLGLG